MSVIAIPPEADEAQRRSSDPRTSVWVSANAGAGKTYVLAQRVVRLLLAGASPSAILCLTYTNAAAAEMAGRVFGTLAALATLPKDALAARVAVLAPEADPDEAARRARTLFALTLETPGGLKVSTLHAFAAQLLRRFPLEANVSGAFKILDDPTRIELTDRAIAATLAQGAVPDSAVAKEIAAALPFVADVSLGDALKVFLGARDALLPWLAEPIGMHSETGMRSDADVRQDLIDALALDTTPLPPILSNAHCRALIDTMRQKGVGGAKADRLEDALRAGSESERDALLAGALLTAAGTPVKNFLAKAVSAALPDLVDTVAREQVRLAAERIRTDGERVIDATLPLAKLAWRALTRIEAEKRRRGLIDYDDQITTATNLVKGAAAAAWVRFKLDEGIDHLMLDEAQDTAPAQWELIEALTDEFYAGEGARETHRTLFVVGDEKQSIYSFQGAAPHLFKARRGHYEHLAQGAARPFTAVDLAHSFRSAPQVLAAVDLVFAQASLSAAVGAAETAVRHRPVRALTGGVDVWPLVGDDLTETSDAWDAPFDQAADSTGPVKLVRAIADQIEAWRTVGPDGGPPVDPGGVLILSRKRGAFASLMNRELKARGIPAAGSDRLDVMKHIAVMDMAALARALISTDDLALAAVLKSPLFGFCETALFALAHPRQGSLMDALKDGDDEARAAHETLMRWRRAALKARPFDFFAGILVSEGRRADFAARMGSEAEDALDAFLDIALQFEGEGIPALEPFLMRLTKMSSEIRRIAEGKAGKVRVMTVHGAKGLEADVVFLADLGGPTQSRRGPALATLPLGESGNVLALVPPKAERPPALDTILAAREAAERAEHARLLYVGMTRAERHLVVCGAYKKRAPADGAGTWHAMVHDGLAESSEHRDGPLGEMLAFREPKPPPDRTMPQTARPEPPMKPAAPAWLHRPAEPIARPPPPIVASAEHGAQAAEVGATPKAAVSDDRALPPSVHGTLIHALIEHDGPPEALLAEAARLAPGRDSAVLAGLVAEARAALALPELVCSTVHREVTLIGDVDLGQGVIRRATVRLDRVQTSPDGSALIVDFKTDRAVPEHPSDAPAGYRRQLAIYRALAEPMFGAPVRTAIVWTTAPRFMAVDAMLPRVRAVPSTA